MAYVARPFEFEGQSYILRTASPYGEIKSLTKDLALTFLILAIAFFCFSASLPGLFSII